MPFRHLLCLLFLTVLSNTPSTAAESANSVSASSLDTPQRPNIVLVLADDLGFSDLGSYGSEINTPNLDAIAEEGLRFSNYHTAANCAPARAMLLTGVDAHLAGVPNIPEMLPPELQQYEHYQGVLGDNVVTVATLLEDAGYHPISPGNGIWERAGKLPSQRGSSAPLHWQIPVPITGSSGPTSRSMTLPTGMPMVSPTNYPTIFTHHVFGR